MIVAEIGPNHDGNVGKARELISKAGLCGADAVKFQCHIAEAESLKDAPNPPYYTAESHYDLFERTAFEVNEWAYLYNYTHDLDMQFICSPFSIEAVDLLERAGVDIYKVASGEVTNIPMLKYIATKGKPVLLSSGMSNYDELDEAVMALHGVDITLMQCSSIYPCPYDRVGLNLIAEFEEWYELPVGFSDHTLTNYAAFAAVALGATVIEKHFTLTKEGTGPDFKFSILPDQFKELAEGIKAIEAMTFVEKDDLSPYGEMKQIFEKSLTSVVAIPKGAIVREGMISLRKSGGGLPPQYPIMGKKALRDIPKDSAIQERDLCGKSA